MSHRYALFSHSSSGRCDIGPMRVEEKHQIDENVDASPYRLSPFYELFSILTLEKFHWVWVNTLYSTLTDYPYSLIRCQF